MRNALYILFALILLLSCKKQAAVLSPELLRAEALMLQHPDSALSILSAMPAPSTSDREQYATWCLLLTQAQDKNCICHTSDSLIMIALRYFEKQPDLHHQALALYYAGRVQDDLYNKVEATEYYVQAFDLAKKVKDYHLMALASNVLGIIYRHIDLKDKALEQHFISLESDSLAKDTIGIIYSLREIGRCYLYSSKLDSALLFLEKAIHLSEQKKDTVKNVLLNDIAIVYREQNQMDQAIYYFRKSIEIITDKTNLYATYSALGATYLMLHQLDSAYHYLSQAKHSDYIYTKAGSSLRLSQLERERGNYKLAFDYTDLYNQYKAQIDSFSLNAKIAEIQTRYDKEKILKEKKEVELEKAQQKQIYSFILFIVLAFIYVVYRIHIEKKERDLINSREKIESLKSQLQANEALIEQKKELFSIEYQQASSDKERLTDENKQLAIEINKLEQKYKIDVKDSSNQFLKKIEQLTKTNQFHFQKETRLINEVISHNQLLRQIKQCAQKRTVYKTESWSEVITTIDDLYDGLLSGLQSEYSKLVEEDIQICSLLLLNIKPVEIAYLLSVDEDCLNKRNERIRKKLSIKKPDNIISFLQRKWMGLSGSTDK